MDWEGGVTGSVEADMGPEEGVVEGVVGGVARQADWDWASAALAVL